MFEVSSASHLPKAAHYEELVGQARSLLAGETDWIANAANFSAFVFHSLSDLNWAGFYFHVSGQARVRAHRARQRRMRHGGANPSDAGRARRA
jgi:putative methionine-R-sulfoxide reductase with GAF domain